MNPMPSGNSPPAFDVTATVPVDSDNPADRAMVALNRQKPVIPSLPPELEAELENLKPLRGHRPVRRFAMIIAGSMVSAAGIVLWLHLRPDLTGLPLEWVAINASAWFVGFIAVAWLTLVPSPGRIMPNWRRAGLAALIAAPLFVVTGLLFPRSVPGVSIITDASLYNLYLYGQGCLFWGVTTAVVPVILGALALRGALPVGSVWAGAGIGAAGGSLGGLVLHLHCHIADFLHVGIIHGGVVVVSAAVGALIIPRTVFR